MLQCRGMSTFEYIRWKQNKTRESKIVKRRKKEEMQKEKERLEKLEEERRLEKKREKEKAA